MTTSIYTVQGKEPDYRKVYPIKERETGIYSFFLKDEALNPVGIGDLNTATLTLYSVESGAIVNLRNAVDIKNANNVTIDAAGKVTWAQQVADVTVLDDSLAKETHRALFLFTWNSAVGVRNKPYEVDFEIENLDKLT